MNKTNNDTNTTHVAAMTPDALRAARKVLGLNQTELAAQLQTPLRTLQEWESGRRRVPGVVAVAVRLLQERDRWVMQSITEKINADLDHDQRFLPRR